MALTATKVTSSPVVTDKATVSNSNRVFSSLSKSKKREKLQLSRCRVEVGLGELHGCLLTAKVKVTRHERWNSYGKPLCLTRSSKSSVLCFSGGSRQTEATECARPCDNSVDLKCARTGDDEDEHPTVPRTCKSNPVLAEACRFVYNDAKFVNERARNDFFLLSRGLMRLDARARQGVAILGSEFLKLDARAREDTEAIDRNVKKKAERLQRIASTLREKAQSRLKTAADEHWSDGALEADLRLADFRAKQRAMEDALMSLEFVKNIHHMMVRKMYNFPLSKENGFPSVDDDMMGHIKLEKNGKSLEFLSGELSTDRISAIQEIYWSMASALSEADGIDYTDPEELELLIRILMDLDAMDCKSSVSLLAECSSSPDENTRQALANALAAAPSMWTLGNAGMGALQRLAEDSNPAIASAASKAIKELKKQWEIEEGDSWRFTLNQKVTPEADDDLDIEKCS